MTKRKKLLIICICAAAACAAALGAYFIVKGVGAMYSAIDRTDMMAEGKFEEFLYRVYVPEDHAETQYPLVLYLHGSGERGGDNRAQTKKNSVMQTLLNDENLAAYPCIVLAPQCPAESWWEPEPLMALLENLAPVCNADPTRIYVTGLSMGGYGTWNLLAEYPDTFAAAVPICGGGDPESASRFKDVPVWAFHGAKDNVVPPEATREMVQAMKDAEAKDARYTEYPDEKHGSWEPAYREPGLFPWLFAQVRGEG